MATTPKVITLAETDMRSYAWLLPGQYTIAPNGDTIRREKKSAPPYCPPTCSQVPYQAS